MIGMLDYIIKKTCESYPDFAAIASHQKIQEMREVVLKRYEQIYPSSRDNLVVQKEIITYN
jgi:hypothetical protein